MQEKIKLILDKINPYFLIFLISIFGFKFNFFSSVNNLDLSWVWAINYVSSTDIYVWGKDVFFTYGPLGYLLMPATIGHNLYLGYIFYALLFFVLVGFLIYSAKNIKNYSSKLGFLLLFFILVFLTADIFLFVPVFSSLLYWFENKQGREKASFIFFSLALIFSLILLFAKTNLGITSLITLAFAFIAESMENKKINIKYLGWGLLYLAVISSLMVWLYFENFSIMLNWLKNSLVIAAGYAEGMVRIGKWFNQLLLFDALIIIFMLLHIFKENFKAKTQNAACGFILIPYLFFQFKAGFVRQDLHMLVFYQSILFVLVVLLLFGEIKTQICKKLSVLIFVFTLALPILYNNFNTKYNLFSSTQNLSKNSQKMVVVDNELPFDWITAIGKNRVEILPFDFSSAAKYNLNIQFNPILQLYSVYTKELDDISAMSFESGENAPKYVLIHDFFAIDNRNMFFDNPATWQSIKENYEVVDCRDGKILLKQRKNALKKEFVTFKTEEYLFNEQIIVPKGAQKALINTNLSLLGQITNFVFRLSPVKIYVTDKSNKEWKYRQVRDVLKNGLYVGSFATDIYQLNNWLEDVIPTLQMKSFKLNVRHPIFYEKKIKIEWQQ